MTAVRYNPTLWAAMSGRAGKWRAGQHEGLYRPDELRALPYRRCVYVPVRQDRHGHVIDYVGSAVRRDPGSAWQRVVGEHQRKHLDRALDWSKVALIGLRDDTPVIAVRWIEAAVADLAGRPPRCVRLPVLPVDWRQFLADMPPDGVAGAAA